jgi:hypothetical protein
MEKADNEMILLKKKQKRLKLKINKGKMFNDIKVKKNLNKDCCVKHDPNDFFLQLQMQEE